MSDEDGSLAADPETQSRDARLHAAEPPAALWLDDARRVRIDLPCLSCTYNLRTQPADGVCPECGHAVVNSLPLWLQPPRWLRRVSAGLALLVVGPILIVIIAFAENTLIEDPPLPDQVGQTARWMHQLPLWLELLDNIPVAMMTLSAFWLTAPNSLPNWHVRQRRTTRYLAALTLIGFVAASFVPETVDWSAWLFVFLLLLLFATLLSALVHVRALFSIAPAPRLRRFATFHLWSTVAVLLFVSGLLVVFNRTTAPRPPYAIPAPSVTALSVAPSSGPVAPQYLVYEADGTVTRTTTAPASYLASAPPRIYSSVDALLVRLLVSSAVVLVLWLISSLVLMIALGVTLHFAALRRRRAEQALSPAPPQALI